MAVTPASFKARFPEFDSIDDARVQIFIDQAICLIDKDRWDNTACGLFDLGVSYLAAHLLKLSEIASTIPITTIPGAGNVTQKKAGDVSVSYGGFTNLKTFNAEWYARTLYGQEFFWLVQKVGAGIQVV